MSNASQTDIPHRTGIAYGVHVPTDSEYRRRAVSKALDLGSLNGSIEDGDGNVVGLLSEFVLSDLINAERDATYEYDLQTPERRIDVKTKRRTVAPEGHYEVSIADHNTEQDCDWYYFSSVNVETGIVWFLGYLSPAEYYDRATFHEAGDKDPENGFTFKADCYNVRIDELKQPKAYADWLGDAADKTLAFETAHLGDTDA